jgi:hypothetical protein
MVFRFLVFLRNDFTIIHLKSEWTRFFLWFVEILSSLVYFPYECYNQSEFLKNQILGVLHLKFKD